jgi:hypothetical protein
VQAQIKRVLPSKQARNRITEIIDRPAEGNIEIKFGEGGAFLFLDVPEDLFDQLTQAEDSNRFFRDHMKGRYKHERVTPAVQ